MSEKKKLYVLSNNDLGSVFNIYDDPERRVMTFEMKLAKFRYERKQETLNLIMQFSEDAHVVIKNKTYDGFAKKVKEFKTPIILLIHEKKEILLIGFTEEKWNRKIKQILRDKKGKIERALRNYFEPGYIA